MAWVRYLLKFIYTTQSLFVLVVASCSLSTPSPAMPKEAGLPTVANPAATLAQTSDQATFTTNSPASPTPVGTITATLAPRKTEFPNTPMEIPDLPGTEIVETVIATGKRITLQSARSPDGKWRAEVIRYDCVRAGIEVDENAYEVVKLIRLDDGLETVLDTQLQNCGGLGAAGLGVEFWSANSQFIYITEAREGVPDGCSGGWWRPLVAYDVLNGGRENLALGPLSPDRKMLVFPREKELVLWDLNKGEVGRLPLLHQDWVVWDIAWSPKGNELVYLQTEDVCVSMKSSVVQVKMTELVQSEIMETASPGFTGVTYVSPGQIHLYDQNNREWLVTLAPKP